MRVIRHAVSIDERRAFFRQNLFGAAHDPQQDMKELWFAGVHSNMGGSYPESERQLSKIAFQWMVCEAELAGLRIDQNRKADMLGGKPPYVAPDPHTKNQHESLHGLWWIAELWPKIAYVETSLGVWTKHLRMNLARRRWIAPDPVVHSSVDQRLRDKSLGYSPGNLPAHHLAGDCGVDGVPPAVTSAGSSDRSEA